MSLSRGQTLAKLGQAAYVEQTKNDNLMTNEKSESSKNQGTLLPEATTVEKNENCEEVESQGQNLMDYNLLLTENIELHPVHIDIDNSITQSELSEHVVPLRLEGHLDITCPVDDTVMILEQEFTTRNEKSFGESNNEGLILNDDIKGFKNNERRDEYENNKGQENLSNENIKQGKLIDNVGINSHKIQVEIQRDERGIQERGIQMENNENEYQVSSDESTSDTEFVTVKSKEKLKANLRRVQGKSYFGYRVIGKKVSHDAPKEKRQMKGRCNHGVPTKKSERSFCCANITDNDREIVFAKFWSMKTWPEKRGFVQGLVNTRSINRRRKNQQEIDNKRKKLGHDIYLEGENIGRQKVCRAFFINTLGIGEDSFKRWTKPVHSALPNSEDESELPSNNSAQAATKTRRQFKKEKDVESVMTWINLLPKVPSHYCRQSTKKLYVESTFRSKRHMHSVYEEWCKENNIKPAIRTIFCKVLEENNIGIHKPRKDQCDICNSYNEGHLTKDKYDTHILRKSQAREEKNKEKDNASDTKKVLTMDLQSNLLCPITLASSMYYKQKLTVHNFTLRELNEGHVRLYVWHEVDGGVSANEFSSCLVDYILDLADSFKQVVLISDGCCSQNRNKILSTALLDTARQKNITIEQLYLQRGHTMMEADNVHATLEHYFRPPIYSPTDYISRMHLARPEKPYEVKIVHYDFFKNYSKMDSVLPSIRPGIGVGEKCVTDICKIKYTPDGEMFLKTDFLQEWTLLPHRRSKVDPFRGLNSLYLNEIPLPESKYKDLQSLQCVIDRQYHDFYANLPFKPDNVRKNKNKDAADNREQPQKKGKK